MAIMSRIEVELHPRQFTVKKGVNLYKGPGFNYPLHWTTPRVLRFRVVGWAIDPLWAHFEAEKGRVASMIDRKEAIAIWERTSGLKADPAALAWWELFNAVKGMGIWISAAKEYRDGGFKDPVLGISGWYTARRHDQIIAHRLARMEGLA